MMWEKWVQLEVPVEELGSDRAIWVSWPGVQVLYLVFGVNPCLS